MNTSNLSGLLSDRQIRSLCEVPVAELQFLDLRTRGVSNRIHVAIFENELADLDAHSARLGKIFANNEQAERVDLFDKEFIAKQRAEFKPMIEPFSPVQVRTRETSLSLNVREDESGSMKKMQLGQPFQEKIVSFGLTSYGYDVTCGDEFKIFTNVNSSIVDPKNFDDKSFVDFKGDVCIIPPNSFVLARTRERFCLPRDIVADCLGKSTYARCGISIMVTPLEPGWEGYLTLEFANTTPLPAKLYANEGCGQVRFFRGSEDCEVAYNDRGGKYMNQQPVPIPPRM